MMNDQKYERPKIEFNERPPWMSKADWHRYRECGRKRTYGTREAAGITGQRVYKCAYCGWWHRTGPFLGLTNPVLREIPLNHYKKKEEKN